MIDKEELDILCQYTTLPRNVVQHLCKISEYYQAIKEYSGKLDDEAYLNLVSNVCKKHPDPPKQMLIQAGTVSRHVKGYKDAWRGIARKENGLRPISNRVKFLREIGISPHGLVLISQVHEFVEEFSKRNPCFIKSPHDVYEVLQYVYSNLLTPKRQQNFYVQNTMRYFENMLKNLNQGRN